jgi:hypothetical protein
LEGVELQDEEKGTFSIFRLNPLLQTDPKHAQLSTAFDEERDVTRTQYDIDSVLVTVGCWGQTDPLSSF